MAMRVPKNDKSQLLPPHKGYNILPNYEFLASLLRNAYQGLVAIRDVNLHLEKTYEDLLSDALRLRVVLLDILPKAVLEKLDRDDEVFIGLLAPGGYEYAVAFVAIIALGAAVVPMSAVVPAQEALYYVQKAQQVAIITSDELAPLGKDVVKLLGEKPEPVAPVVPVMSSISKSKRSPVPCNSILISADPPLDPMRAVLVIFTSGTTGPPKGAVISRNAITGGCLDLIASYHIRAQQVLLHVLPVHHATGLFLNFLPILFAGGIIEFKSGSFDPAWTWERWREGSIDIFSGVPTIFMRMRRYYEDHLSNLEVDLRGTFEKGAREIGLMLCGTSALPRPLQQFWERLRQSKTPIATRYGATEIGAIIRMTAPLDATPEGSVGILSPGNDVELRDEQGKASDEGEILVRSPWLFSKYLHDEVATAKAFDYRGYFQTGDIAKREGQYYFILGRASQDIIKSGGYKISALDIERELLSLPNISEAAVVGIEDPEWGQRVSAILTLRESTGVRVESLKINRLREALRDRLAAYKLPSLLWVMRGDLPKGPSGKVQKILLKGQMVEALRTRHQRTVQVWANRKAKL